MEVPFLGLGRLRDLRSGMENVVSQLWQEELSRDVGLEVNGTHEMG